MTNKKQTQGRYTWQQQQEDLSTNQFKERMIDFGWLADRVERDIGEDLIVRILTSTQPVGLLFYAQLKSVTDLQRRKRLVFVRYPLEVVDLLRWEVSSLPVALVVWDVDLREGRWQIVKSLIAHLDETVTNWRSQKKVTVQLPWKNGTDDSGLGSLRAEIGYLLYSLVAAGRNIDIKFTVVIPDTDEAKPAKLQLQKFVQEGTPLAITEEHLQDVQFSDWWSDWFLGPDTKIKISRMEMIPQPHPDAEPVSIMVLSSSGQVARFPSVDLQLIRSGTHYAVLSNAHQNDALTFTITVPKLAAGHREGNVTFAVNHVGYNVLETREIVRFLQGITVGGKLTILFRRHGGTPLSMNFQPPTDDPFGGYLDPTYVKLVENLCMVQERLGQEIRLPDGDIDAKDMRAAYELESIVREGKTVVLAPSLSLTGRWLDIIKNLHEHHRQSETGSLLKYQYDAENSYVLLFGNEIQVGQMRKTIVGTLATTVQEMEEYLQQGDSEASFTLMLTNVEITEEFADWHRKLSES